MLQRCRALIVAAGLVSAATIVSVPTADAATGHVGIVVRFADGTVSTACATSGGNGLQVLASKFSPTIGQSGPYAGFVLQINHIGQNPPDTAHYWSYWHSAGSGTWTYAASGAGSYTPKAGTVEGWSYVNGEQNAPKPPADTYTSICGAAPTAKPTATPTATPSHASSSARPTRSTAASTSRPPPRPKQAQTRTAHPPATAYRSGPSRPVSHPHASKPGSTKAVPTTSSTSRHPIAVPASPSPAPTAASPAAPTESVDVSPLAGTPHSESHGSAWGTVLVVLVVLAVGAVTMLAVRRRSQ